MKERPILFNAPMVRALLDGSKTQTRRVVTTPQSGMLYWFGGSEIEAEADSETLGQIVTPQGLRIYSTDYPEEGSWTIKCRCGLPGDRLWVRETFNGPLWPDNDPFPEDGYQPKFCEYRADGGPAPWYCDADDNIHEGWKPSIHMPRWASRITLEVTGVRVERLQDISEADTIAEGCAKNHNGYFWGGPHATSGLKQFATAIDAYRDLWGSINGARSWDANPWVWVVEFKRIAPD